ncbi:MAG: hypothetical protein ACQESG_00805 [Nanobdellota archaeon]
MNKLYVGLAVAALAVSAGAYVAGQHSANNEIDTHKVQESQLEHIAQQEKPKVIEQEAQSGFVDPDNYTGTIADQGIEIHIGEIPVDRSSYQQFAKLIPVTIRVPQEMEEPGQERFITYSHSEDAHYFIPNTGKTVTGEINPEDGNVWYQTTLDADGMKLRAGPGVSKTTTVPGHCGELNIVSVPGEMADMLPNNISLHGLESFQDMYSTKEVQALVSPDPVQICTGDSKFELQLKYPK